MYTLNCRGNLLSVDKPLVMGIINVTPDSFYQGHSSIGTEGIISLAERMIRDGADILDIGGQSTRPGSVRLSPEQELERVIPVIAAIRATCPGALLSVDTYHSRVAEKAVLEGASMVNDISGGMLDKEMIDMVAGLRVPYICMHMKGTPENMQKEPVYSDVVKEVLDFFIEKVHTCKVAGIHDVIIDPGFGFGKTIRHNFQLLKNLAVFSMLDKPILAGLSRKSMIYKTLGIPVQEALNGTTVLNTLALMNGAGILRVHDVKEARETVSLFNCIQNQ